MSVLFVYKNYQGHIRRIAAKSCSDPAGVAAALTELLETPVSWTQA